MGLSISKCTKPLHHTFTCKRYASTQKYRVKNLTESDYHDITGINIVIFKNRHTRMINNMYTKILLMQGQVQY